MPTTADAALYTVLNAHAGLAALLGSGPIMRAYPVEAPAGAALPLLIFNVLAVDDGASTHGQGTGTDARLDGVHYELIALAETPLGAAGVLYQARLALEASTTLRGLQTGARGLPRSEDAGCHGRSADFLVWNDPDA